MRTSEHYDDTYFEWQQPLGELCGWANRFKFTPWTDPTRRLVDFGCGGGYLLERLPASERLGIEPNGSARAAAAARGLDVVPSLDDVEDGWADTLISHHALEHALDPYQILERLKPKLSARGVLVIVTPCESYNRGYRADDINHHLFTWSPMNLGHILLEAGYDIERVDVVWHQFPPKSVNMWQQPAAHRVLAWRDGLLFHGVSRVWSRFDRRITQVRAVARAIP